MLPLGGVNDQLRELVLADIARALGDDMLGEPVHAAMHFHQRAQLFLSCHFETLSRRGGDLLAIAPHAGDQRRTVARMQQPTQRFLPRYWASAAAAFRDQIGKLIDKVPLLGSGKTDYVAATALVRELAGTPEEREVA